MGVDAMKRIIVAAAIVLGAGSANAFDLSFLGNSVLQWLTPADAKMLNRALNAALSAEKEGTEERWSNSESGASGSITFRREFQRAGAPCRSIQIKTTAQAITQGGVYELCRQPDGTWSF
jgi:surface antigen